MKKMLALLMLLCLLPAVASATIKVNGKSINDVSYTIKSNDAVITGDGQPTNVQLILSSSVVRVTLGGNVNIVTKSGPALRTTSKNTVTVKLVGTNTLDASAADGYAGLQQDSVQLTANNNGMGAVQKGRLDITGSGKLIAKGGSGSAGIGGNYVMSKTEGAEAAIKIHSGEIVAIGGKNAAGIGSGFNADGYVEILGGNITAQGGSNAPGIGCGSINKDVSYALGTVWIRGGTVNATGGEFGPGIGGGSEGCKSYVRIQGGTVNAKGGQYGAGIGGGLYYGNTEVFIDGGDVTAIGGDGTAALCGGAGIGGGRGYDESTANVTLTIEGGKVYAAGGSYAKAFGGNSKGTKTIQIKAISKPVAVSVSNDDKDYTAVEGSPFSGTKAVTSLVKDYRYLKTDSLCKVSFEANGASGSMDTELVPQNSEYMLPGSGFTPRTGEKFFCWEINEQRYMPGDKVRISQHTTAKAIWLISSALTFEPNGGKGEKVIVDVERNSWYKLPECMFEAPNDKMEFDIWKTGEAFHDEEFYEEGAYTYVTEKRVFKATWKNLATIHFQKNGGQGTMDSVYTSYDEKYKLPECGFTDPNREFAFWQVNNEGEFYPGDEIDLDPNRQYTYVTAKWKAKIRIYFSANGGTGSMSEVKVCSNEEYTLPECSFTAPNGKKFVGWDVSGKSGVFKPGDSFVATLGTYSITAMWEGNAHTFTYTDGTHSKDIAVKYGDKYRLEGWEFAKDGHTFAGWEIDGTVYQADTKYPITGDVTATATWTANDHTVTYIDGDKRVEVAVKYGDVFVPDENMVKPADGYHLAGWIIDGTKYNLGSVPQGTIGGNVTVSPVWEANEHTVTYTDGTTSTTVGVKYGDEHVLENCGFTYPGHTFAGWEIDGTVYQAGAEYPITGDVTVTATWTDLYDVTFDANGGTGTMATEYADVTGKYTLPACGFTAPKNAEFGYWVVGESTEGQLPGTVITLKGDAVAKAIWNIGESKTKTETVSTDLEEVDIDQISKTLIEALGKTNDDTAKEVIAAIVEKMETELTDLGVSDGQMAHYEVELMISYDDGKTWVKATPENFPENGLTITIPYPEGTNRFDFMFTVVHMFAEGEKAGLTEMPDVTLTDDGVTFTVTGLSPISIGWMPKPANADLPQTGDPSSLLGWMALLGASGMALKLRRKK